MVSVPATTASPSLWHSRLRLAAAGIISAIPVALVFGLLSRVAMRITALLENEPTGFSVFGTLGVALVWIILFGLPSGILAPLIMRNPDRRWTQSLITGLALFLLMGIPFLIVGPNGLDTAHPRWLNLTMYGALFFLHGVCNAWAYVWYEHRLKHPEPGRRGRLLWYGFLTSLAPISIVFFVLAFATNI